MIFNTVFQIDRKRGTGIHFWKDSIIFLQSCMCQKILNAWHACQEYEIGSNFLIFCSRFWIKNWTWPVALTDHSFPNTTKITSHSKDKCKTWSNPWKLPEDRKSKLNDELSGFPVFLLAPKRKYLHFSYSLMTTNYPESKVFEWWKTYVIWSLELRCSMCVLCALVRHWPLCFEIVSGWARSLQ